MKNNFKLFTLAALAAATVFTSCSDEETTPVIPPVKDGDFPAEIKEDMTFDAGNYTISGAVKVKAGATLTLKPGVIVTAKYDSVLDYLLIEQGAKIDAQGTADAPIVFKASALDGWGGIHICGRAPINGDGSSSEIGEEPYGGNDVNDNSGILKYVRVENSGKTISSEKEANGFSLYGVGAGTQISYCQAYKGSDDGFEFFGGTAKISHCVIVDCTDDSVDWTQGWRGQADHILVIQSEGSDCDCLMECDNSGSGNSRMPVAHPTISNVTLIGDGDGKGPRFREGTQINFYNSVVANAAKPMIVESDYTNASFIGDWSALTLPAGYDTYKVKSNVEGVALCGVMATAGTESVTAYTTDAFLAAGNKENVEFAADAPYKYILKTDLTPSAKGVANYVGAFDPAAAKPWTAGAWCIID